VTEKVTQASQQEQAGKKKPKKSKPNGSTALNKAVNELPVEGSD
jgi:hypothetical protein